MLGSIAPQDKYVYGIRTLSVYSNRLRSIVESCTKAKASSDARDKVFLELVSEVDISVGMGLQRAAAYASNMSISMAKTLSAVQDNFQPFKTCLQAKKEANYKIGDANAETVDIMGAITRFGMQDKS